MELFSYQKAIVDQLVDKDNWALFVGTGGGKTLMSLTLLQMQNYENIIIVCRKNKVKEWEEDAGKHVGNRNVLIINYESIHKLNPDDYKGWFILLDESQNIKTPSSKRYKHLKKFKTRKCCFGLLSGTPQHSLYEDYYTSMFLLGIYKKSLTQFKQEYCVMFQPPGALYQEIVDYKNVDELLMMLDDTCIAWYQQKSEFEPIYYDVRFKRPPIVSQILKDQVFEDVLFDTPGKTALFTRIMETGVFQGNVLDTSKMDWILSNIPLDKRVIIFTNFIDELNYVCDRLACYNIDYNVYSGGRKDIINKRIAVVNCNAGGSGINDFADFDIAIFHSLPVKYIELEQAIGRIDRYGQSKPPLIYFLLYPDEMRRQKQHNKKLEFDNDMFSTYRPLKGGD